MQITPEFLAMLDEHIQRQPKPYSYATLARDAGIRQSTVSRWKTGETKEVTEEACASLARAMGMHPEAFRRRAMGIKRVEEPRATYSTKETVGQWVDRNLEHYALFRMMAEKLGYRE